MGTDNIRFTYISKEAEEELASDLTEIFLPFLLIRRLKYLLRKHLADSAFFYFGYDDKKIQFKIGEKITITEDRVSALTIPYQQLIKSKKNS